ncbi:hypothetical protein ONE63_005471 [Megalurothrips usitatus]|uniref:Uncharacterized protein n=1 Tax=Megalurothrips usitatus TaxID=439358 RepID=A0AAV7XVJ3_9NEOP|nr:hypothetical protein ONE63_005471 [Megalurothrips usitatus]
MNFPEALLLALAMTAVRESSAASTVITTGADGSINCDGMRCPAGDGVRCVVSSETLNGQSTVHRQCVGPAGEVILQSDYNVETPGMTFGRQSATAIMYTRN